MSINSEIERILKAKDAMIIDGTQSLLEILEALRKQVTDELGRAALGPSTGSGWDAYHLKDYLREIGSAISEFKGQATAQTKKGLEAAWEMGKDLVDKPLASGGIYAGFHLSTSMLDVLKDFTFHKIDGLTASAWDKIRGELTMGVLGGKTPAEVAKAIGMNLDDPSIFGSIARRAEVITKTEMGRVFSTATELRMEDAAKHVDGLEKQWRHVGHPKIPRSSHLSADGQTVPVDEPFNIGGVMMMYPRDPSAPIDEVINCG